jgi:hypothetical protein
MARSSRMSVQKRQRERKKAEQAELKRSQRRSAEHAPGGQVADRSDLEGYGVIPTFSDSRSET